ncbi:MAG: kynureninase [Chitinophagales bacterium]|nr:kynureninase [Bacteroidota bacterium]
MPHFTTDKAFALAKDAQDALKSFREAFFIPQHKGKDCIYFCGNSLGLQPKTTPQYLEQELEDWQKLGVEGHFEGKNPWFSYHHFVEKPLANLVGAKTEEVVAMNTLTVNLHLMMLSFYRPTAQRFKIMVEGAAFPSDHYAVQSQAKLHGFSPEEAIVYLEPRTGEHCLRTEDILARIEAEKDQLTLVMLGGVNYYTGQFFDLKTITEAAHKAGAMAGFDLAHAVGNMPLSLHDWQVDFAVWCSYKYLNSGPGSVAGAFVHEKHTHNTEIVRLEGWWSNREDSRFKMRRTIEAQQNAAAWQMSNAPVLSLAAHRAALDIFERAGGMEKLRQKSLELTAYLAFLLEKINEKAQQQVLEVITPTNASERGCQLSIIVKKNAKPIFERITAKGVVADWREPDVIRVAPVPLYNKFEEVFIFAEILADEIFD